VLGIATDLNVDLTVLAEDLMHSRSEVTISFRLEKAFHVSASNVQRSSEGYAYLATKTHHSGG
jgi:hypothetical protein